MAIFYLVSLPPSLSLSLSLPLSLSLSLSHTHTHTHTHNHLCNPALQCEIEQFEKLRRKGSRCLKTSFLNRISFPFVSQFLRFRHTIRLLVIIKIIDIKMVYLQAYCIFKRLANIKGNFINSFRYVHHDSYVKKLENRLV